MAVAMAAEVVEVATGVVGSKHPRLAVEVPPAPNKVPEVVEAQGVRAGEGAVVPPGQIQGEAPPLAVC